jgi:hypothetical protein
MSARCCCRRRSSADGPASRPRATRFPESDLSTTSARPSRVKSSTTIRMGKCLPSATMSDRSNHYMAVVTIAASIIWIR